MDIYSGPDFRIRTVDAGRLRLDGGAMFGVVPKPLWSKRAPADERNRITLAMRCLLVEGDGFRLLVDTGLGNKEDEKFHRIYAIENAGDPTRLEVSLRRAEVEPTDITHVLNTHLHFDHAGGNTMRTEGGAVRASFPNARYLIRRGEWEFAHLDNERVRASYLGPNFDPLLTEERVDFLAADGAVLPGIEVVRAAGHTPYHQCVLIETAGGTFCYLADLVPTVAHLPLPWIMGYDVEPLTTLETKRELLGRAGAAGWGLIFEHDPRTAWGRAARPAGGRDGCELVESVAAADEIER
jgi:glyoxylase-like metal-dependent hydrolase (beta-lactamase superfamily II)